MTNTVNFPVYNSPTTYGSNVVTWALSNSHTAQKLERYFAGHGIPFDQPGFMDHPNFLQLERTQPRVMESYAHYVETRAYDPAYLQDARAKIEVVCDRLHTVVEEDGRLGACVDTSGMLGRMLDELGIWNYVAKTNLAVIPPATSGLQPLYFYSCDVTEFTAAHAVVIAPPFYVLDLTVRQQAFDDAFKPYLPSRVLLDTYTPHNWTLNEIVAPELRQMIRLSGVSLETFLRQHHKGLFEVSSILPSRGVAGQNEQSVDLGYVIVAVGGSIEGLSGITGYQPCGRLASEIFQTDILPAL